MNKHWRYEPDGSTGMNDCCVWGPEGPGHEAICNVASTGLLYSKEQWEEFRNRGRLIAAAPDMLDELKQARIDVNNLLAEILAHQENTGQMLEQDDAAIVNEIETRYRTGSSKAIAKAEAK